MKPEDIKKITVNGELYYEINSLLEFLASNDNKIESLKGLLPKKVVQELKATESKGKLSPFDKTLGALLNVPKPKK